ncbi:hypothetical protein BDQ17DRAFT_1256900, partial [Cyathus striatus]
IKHVHIDEAHSIFTIGLPHYGLHVFCPAWGCFGELCVQLHHKTPFQVLSGTQPPHIRKAIIANLQLKPLRLSSVILSCNCPDISYAIHQITNSLSDYRNLDFLIPNPYPVGFTLCKTIVFHDSIQSTQDASIYMNGLLPLGLQYGGIVQHYYSAMSTKYLKIVFKDFANPAGTCRVLHAMEGASTV